MIYTVNGEEVDYIHIDKVSNRIDIQYYEKFDVVTAHTSRIISRLKDKQINAIVCKNLYRGYIGFFLEHIEDYIGVIHILEIPMNACQVDRDNNFLLLRIDEIPKYHDKSFEEILEKTEE